MPVTLRLAAALCLMLVALSGLMPVRAIANDCAQQCYAQENSCRRATQGSQSCDAALTRCLQACRTKR
jgi:hypothetical protein